MEREAYTIDEFCRSHGFSRAHYFNMQKDGQGPRVMRLGSRVLISREAAADWRVSREAAAA
jgi:predicted DNA-binding transcriptional regulator AlpA